MARVAVPLDEAEHEQWKAHAEEQGFDALATYIKWLVRRDMEKKGTGGGE